MHIALGNSFLYTVHTNIVYFHVHVINWVMMQIMHLLQMVRSLDMCITHRLT